MPDRAGGPVWVKSRLLGDGPQKMQEVWASAQGRELVRSHKSRTRCCCAYCGAPSEHETGTCIVTLQYCDEEESCTVCQAEYKPQETVSR